MYQRYPLAQEVPLRLGGVLLADAIPTEKSSTNDAPVDPGRVELLAGADAEDGEVVELGGKGARPGVDPGRQPDPPTRRVQLVDQTILPGLDDHMGPVLEEMAREHARGLAASGELIDDQVDSWWSPDGRREVDLVDLTQRKQVSFVGSVKWSARALRPTVLTNLEQHAVGLPGFGPHTPRLVYGRGGCAPNLAAIPGVRCFSVEELYE